MIDPLTDIMATAHMDAPIYTETAKDMGPEEILAELTREYLHPALEAAGVENPEQYSLEWEEPAKERYGRWLHADEIPARARRPWVSAEQLDATQQIPAIKDEPQ